MDYHGILWSSVDDHGLSKIIMGLLRILDYYGLWTIVHYPGLSCIIVNYHDDHGFS